ncbi:hypothetical protein GL246_09380 [Escherichia coli]|nr:hypothetical protein [Escherichia coli]
MRLNTGKEVDGVLKDHSDWLIGCPIVETECGEQIGIGYQGEIVGIAPKLEVK